MLCSAKLGKSGKALIGALESNDTLGHGGGDHRIERLVRWHIGERLAEQATVAEERHSATIAVVQAADLCFAVVVAVVVVEGRAELVCFVRVPRLAGGRKCPAVLVGAKETVHVAFGGECRSRSADADHETCARARAHAERHRPVGVRVGAEWLCGANGVRFEGATTVRVEAGRREVIGKETLAVAAPCHRNANVVADRRR